MLTKDPSAVFRTHIDAPCNVYAGTSSLIKGEGVAAWRKGYLRA